MRPLLLVLGALLAAGCAGGDEDTSAPAPTTAASEGRCTAATSDLMTPLANKLTIADARLTNGWIVESTDHRDVYFVAAEIDSPELAGSGDIAVWATTSPYGVEAVYSVNEVATRYSDWRAGDVIDVSADDDGVAESRACVFR